MAKQSNDKELISVFKLLHQGVKKIGFSDFKAIIYSLVKENDFKDKKHDILINIIIECVLQEWNTWQGFKITREDLIVKGGRGEVAEARKAAIYFIIEYIPKVNRRTVSNYFGGRDRQIVYAAKTEYDALDEKNKLDKPLITRYKRTDKRIKSRLSEVTKPE